MLNKIAAIVVIISLLMGVNTLNVNTEVVQMNSVNQEQTNLYDANNNYTKLHFYFGK